MLQDFYRVTAEDGMKKTKSISYGLTTILCYTSDLHHYCVPGTENDEPDLILVLLQTWSQKFHLNGRE